MRREGTHTAFPSGVSNNTVAGRSYPHPKITLVILVRTEPVNPRTGISQIPATQENTMKINILQADIDSSLNIYGGIIGDALNSGTD